jgi:peroxiredoxin Q/BCP
VHVSGEVYIGEKAPDFELDASNGHPLQLSSTRGDWVLVVFDGRKESLRDLKAKVEEAHSFGVKILGVCDEKAYVLKSWADREQMPFLLLADPTGEISAMYGLYDGERFTTGPGFVLVDRDGIVRMALLGQRLPADDILRLARFAVTGS